MDIENYAKFTMDYSGVMNNSYFAGIKYFFHWEK